MLWNSGYEVVFYANYVDAVTWVDGERLELLSGSVNNTGDGLRQSASLSATDYERYTERLIRVYADAVQEQNVAHVPLFTGFATSPQNSYDGATETQSIDCYSVLKPAEDVLLPRGWYAGAGNAIDSLIKDLLSVTPAPIVIVGEAPKLAKNIVAENNESRLTMVDKILKAVSWRLNISGNGSIILRPVATAPAALFDNEFDIVEPDITKEYDWFSAPNVFRAVIDNVSATARDDDPSSPLSTESRGREVWQEEEGVALAENQTLAEYAEKRLKELQAVGETITYSRRFLPEVYVGDIVTLDYNDLKGNYRITSQKLELSYNLRTSEECVAV